ncbi:tea1 [Symbiodinium natans]|uniref:Tea1 protein n=1 Tax=Symbiodinium natans TaxID=878477 RepID=A0A812PLA3_9DINO|nr:tea1 [Symbiodinium natans]
MNSAMCAGSGGKVYLFGGYNVNNDPAELERLNDAWVLDLSVPSWAEVSVTPGTEPAGTSIAESLAVAKVRRAGHSMVCTGDSLLVFGGQSMSGGVAQRHNDLWKLTLATSTWQQLTQTSGTLPPPRSGHSAVWNPDTQSMLVYAGANSVTNLNDLWSYSLTANVFTQLTPTGGPQGERWEHAALWNPVDNTMFITAGFRTNVPGTPGVLLGNDLWSYDPQANTWTELIPQGSPNAPAGRRQTSLVWNTAAQAALLFAGHTGGVTQQFLDDLWEYKAGSWTQLVPASSPPARGWHLGAWASTQVMIVFGGYDGSYLVDTWQYTP